MPRHVPPSSRDPKVILVCSCGCTGLVTSENLSIENGHVVVTCARCGNPILRYRPMALLKVKRDVVWDQQLRA